MGGKNKEFEQRKKKIQDFFFNKLKINNKYALIFIGIFVLALVLRLIYFNINKAVWWDEAVYLIKAKSIALGTPSNGWGAHRSVGIPLIWSLFYLLGANEFVIRLTEVAASLAAVWLTYKLGKEMFNPEIGLIASGMLSVSYLHLFYTSRLLLDNFNLLFSLLLVYLVWKGLKQNKYMYWAAAVGAFGLISFSSIGFLGLGIAIFLIIYEKKRLFTQKKYWITLLIFVLCLLPWAIYNVSNYGTLNPTLSQVADKAATNRNPISSAFFYFKLLPTYLSWPYLIMLITGFVFYIPMLFSLDILVKKNKVKRYQNKVLTFLWIIIPFIIFSYLIIYSTRGVGEDRYLLYIFPALFYIASLGLWKLFQYLKKFNSIVAWAFLILILIGGATMQLRQADTIIRGKETSYIQVKQAGEWIKQHSEPDDIIISHSIPQNVYYSERTTKMFTDRAEFDAYLKENDPRYLVVSVFENSPEWFFNYPNEAQLQPVQGYFADKEQQNPVLIIYSLK